MKKSLVSLSFCILLIHCKKNETQALHASLVDVVQEDKVANYSPAAISEKSASVNSRSLKSCFLTLKIIFA
ncbi:hypothetical protein VUJ46_00030 [Chryseobacterium sp. MYb264]|uniref:hypothetical protein n=1 Tax=Chryseobacterium sp. MYb264 TaxID=2745153 RepID=UPI002E10F97A|nr:hypothetical protein VUJ46_00030 [Chryseobacterium sp. MYb264]